MNPKTTLTVVTVALTLGVLFLIFETDLFDRKLPSDRGHDAPVATGDTESGKPIAGLDKVQAEEVQRIRVEREGEPAVVVERDGKGWVQAEPVKFPLQAFEIDRLVSDALGLRSTSSFKPSQKKLTLKDLGFAPARVKVTLEPKEGKPVALSLGKRTAGGVAYIAVGEPSESADAYVVADSLHASLLEKDFKDWRNRSLGAFAPGSIRSLTLEREGDTIVLTQSDGRWAIEQPFQGRADRNGASQLALAPSAASIRDFVQDKPESLAAFGLVEPEISMTIEVAETNPAAADPTKPEAPKTEEAKTIRHTLTIGNPQTLAAESYFAMWDNAPVVFTLAKTDVDKLRKPAADLRDPSLTPVNKADLRTVKVERPGQPSLALTREEGHWKWADPAPPFALAGEQVDQLVAAIFDTKAREYVALDAAKLAAPIATVAMTLIGGDREEKLSVHGEGEKLTVVRDGEATGYVVDKAALAPLFESPLAYRDRTVLDIQQENLTELRVLRTGEQVADYHVTRTSPSEGSGPGGWNLVGYDAEAFHALLDRIAPLLASEWLAEPPVTTPEGVSVELTMKDGAKHKLFIHPESQTARVEGVPEAFKVDSDLATAATTELRDRVALKLESAKIASVKLGQGVIVRDAQGKYKVEGADLDEQEAAAVYDTLAGLTVERYLPADAIPTLGDPAHTLTVQTEDDKTHTLTVWPPAETNGQRWIARLDDSKELLVLSPATASRLIAGEPPVPTNDPEK